MKSKRFQILIGIIGLALIIAVMPLVGACATEAPAPTPTPTPTPTPEPEPEKVYEAILSHPYAETNLWGEMVTMFAAGIEEASGGRVKVTVYPAGTLHATYEASLQACATGITQFGMGNITTPQKYDSRWTCFTVPGAVWGWEHWKRVIETDTYKQLNDELGQQTGFKMMVYTGEGLYGDMVWNNKRPIVTPDDWKGLKIRTAPSPLQIKIVEAFGATPIPLGTTETLAAISQGVVDGGVISAGTAVNAWQAQETLPYATRTAGGFALSSMFVSHMYNVEWFENTLPIDVQQAINAALPKMRDEIWAYTLKGQEVLWNMYEETPDVTVTYLTEEQTKVWADVINENVLSFTVGEFGCADIYKACEASRP